MTNREVMIGDLVYFLPPVTYYGEFPQIYRGRVDQIKATEVHVKVDFKEHLERIWVSLNVCYPTAQELVKAMYTHLMQQAYIVDNPDKEPR